MPKKRVRTQTRKKQVRRGAISLAAAATASTMVLTPVAPPPPRAEADIIMDIINGACDVITCNFWTAGLLTGPLFDIVETVYSIPFLANILPPKKPIDVPVIGPVNVKELIPFILGKFSNPFGSLGFFPGAPEVIAQGNIDASAFFGIHINVGLMDGALSAGQAIPTVQDAIDAFFEGNSYIWALVRNPGRANGGFATRFDPLYQLIFGRTAVSGNVATKFGLGWYVPLKMDVAIGYDSMNDLPAWTNPVSLLNSVAQSFLLTNLLGDMAIKTDFEVSDLFELNVYLTMVPRDNALLEPLRIVGRLMQELELSIPYVDQFVANLDMIADAYEPALDVLINMGYPDVDLTTWERQYSNFQDNVLFSFFPTLGPDAFFGGILTSAWKAIQGTAMLLEWAIPILDIPITDIIGPPTPVDGGGFGDEEEEEGESEATSPDLSPQQQQMLQIGASVLPKAVGDAMLDAAGISANATAEADTPIPDDDSDNTNNDVTNTLGTDTTTTTNTGTTTTTNTGTNDPGNDTTTGTSDSSVNRAREQAEAAKAKLDAAAAQAKARAADAAGGAQSGNGTGGTSGGTADEAASGAAASDPAPGGGAASPGNAAPSSGDAAA